MKRTQRLEMFHHKMIQNQLHLILLNDDNSLCAKLITIILIHCTSGDDSILCHDQIYSKFKDGPIPCNTATVVNLAFDLMSNKMASYFVLIIHMMFPLSWLYVF